MPALLRLPRSAYPNCHYALKGFTSLEHLQQEKWERYKNAHPPHAFNPKSMLEPTIMNRTPNGVELWKWSNDQQSWLLDAEIIWKD